MGASSSWQRESLTFTVPTNAGSSVNVQLKLPGDVSGSVYADCVMLEQADAMNRYNLLENSDFNSNTIWSRGSGLDSNDAIVSVSGSLHPDSLSSAAYKITGSTTADKVVSQTLPISGATGDCYTFGGWAQMNTVPAFTKNAGTSSEVNYGQRKLRLGFVGASETKYYEVSFNPDNSEWQYICGAAVAPEKSLLFSYDANGQAISVNYNGTEYYYLRNGQNDIVSLMDESGVRVVEYIYDAWGKLISTTGTLATTLGADNPFRYRGYYCDTETGLYYLTTRYYDPEVCRFISADVYMSTGQGVLGGNMWAYCLNNPVNRFDTCGTWSMPNWLKITIGVAATALAVAITVSTGGAAAPVIVSVLSSTVGSAAISAVKSRIETGNWDNAGKAALDGASNGLMWGGIGALGGAAIKAVKYTRAVKETKAAAEALKYTKTAARHASERAYMNSTQTVKEIMNAAKPKPDKYIKNGLKWVVKGGMNKRDGMWELVVDSSRKTIVHFLFKT